jgi:hypothetical protein
MYILCIYILYYIIYIYIYIRNIYVVDHKHDMYSEFQHSALQLVT